MDDIKHNKKHLIINSIFNLYDNITNIKTKLKKINKKKLINIYDSINQTPQSKTIKKNKKQIIYLIISKLFIQKKIINIYTGLLKNKQLLKIVSNNYTNSPLLQTHILGQKELTILRNHKPIHNQPTYSITSLNTPLLSQIKKKDITNYNITKSKLKFIINTFKKINKINYILNLNKHGNYEHLLTGLIFDKNEKVIGRQHKSGNIIPLNDNDIITCNNYNFEYTKIIHNKNIENIQLDSLSDIDDEPCFDLTQHNNTHIKNNELDQTYLDDVLHINSENFKKSFKEDILQNNQVEICSENVDNSDSEPYSD